MSNVPRYVHACVGSMFGTPYVGTRLPHFGGVVSEDTINFMFQCTMLGWLA